MHKNGFALLEVLLAWAIFIASLLVILTAQVENLRRIRHTYFKAVATEQLQSMAERLRVNQNYFSRIQEQSLWNRQNQELLPGGKGYFSCVGSICHIVLQWQEWDKKSLTIIVVI